MITIPTLTPVIMCLQLSICVLISPKDFELNLVWVVSLRVPYNVSYSNAHELLLNQHLTLLHLYIFSELNNNIIILSEHAHEWIIIHVQ